MRFRLASEELEHQGRLKLPDPSLLRAHFAVAEIFDASGMGEEIDRVLRDIDEIGVLDENGGSDVGLLVSTAMNAKSAA